MTDRADHVAREIVADYAGAVIGYRPLGSEHLIKLISAALREHATVPPGWRLVPEEPTREMLESALDESGQRTHEYKAHRESGVAVDSDMSAEDAEWINEECRKAFGDTYRAMLAAAPAAPQEKTVTKWQPISTAPKDGTRIWAWFPFDGTTRAVAWRRNDYEPVLGWTLDDGESAVLTYDPPTHWMPLPAPPQGKGE